MKISIPKTREDLKQYLNNPLYKNSFFLVSSRFLNVAAGFFFWMIAAKFYSIEEVGIATALISSLGLVILFSSIGLDASIVRFLPTGDKSKVFNTCLILTTISTLIVGVVYISGVNFFASSLSFIQDPSYAVIFLVFAVMNSITVMTGFAFIAIRRAGYYFLQNILQVSRILLLIPLVFLGRFGIFGSIGLAYLLAAVFAFLNLNRLIKLDFRMDKQFIKESFTFSSGNYISNILFAVPTLIMPILILNLLGGAEAAKYYIAFAIGNIVLIIPDALSTSLFVEGSHGESLRKSVIRAGLAIYSFLVPAVIFIYFFGNFLLGLIGKDYVGASELLILLALSSFFYAVYSLFVPVQNVRMRVESIVKLNLLRFFLLMGLSYVFILKFGIVGVGYAWLVAYGILSLGIVFMVRKMGWV